MGDRSRSASSLPPEQEAIRAKCFHPSGTFAEFLKEEIEQSIPARFEKMVRRYPDRLAVKSRNHAFTYDELNKAANRIARTIVSNSVAGEEPVALFFEQGSFIIAAILGILKAGRIYVPLDPALPSTRIAEMLEDSQAKLLLTNTQHLSQAQVLAQRGQQILNCDEIDATVADGKLDQPVSSESSAVILYTSGSTGRPKGVLHTHCNILVETRNYTNDIQICPEDKLSLCQSCSFANSIRNIYGALLNGAALFPHDLAAEGIPSLVEWLTTNRITIFHTLETIVRRICESIPPDVRFPELRILRFGGEPTSGEDVKSFQRRFAPQCVLMNVIGLTETFSIRRYFVADDLRSGDAKVPLGYGVTDKEVLLLDETGQELGANQMGEIAVRSKHVALGYWGRPDLTRAVFIPDPYGGEERTYLTGDLGIMRPDGCLIHMGRKDFQVKIRGNRIEVTGIETALLELDSIRAAVVHAQSDGAGEQRLVAYVVPVPAKTPTVSELRRALASTLPDYMIPSTFVFLEALPVVPNGRIDRRALPAPNRARPVLDAPYVAPRSPIELELATIWAEILNVEQVGIHDHFFDLGGHSLLAARIISRVIERFHVTVPVRSFFEAPTVAELATRVVKGQAAAADSQDMAHLLAELEGLSDEETRAQLSAKTRHNHE
jgi:amino acid adenylation domain-containing protein